ncbi:MAG: hypothetical protein SPL30_07770 [Succinivibrio sp.]|jgi:hypothetical protein|nr:hypothetical protein [Succinivibrio sp.]
MGKFTDFLNSGRHGRRSEGELYPERSAPRFDPAQASPQFGSAAQQPPQAYESAAPQPEAPAPSEAPDAPAEKYPESAAAPFARQESGQPQAAEPPLQAAPESAKPEPQAPQRTVHQADLFDEPEDDDGPHYFAPGEPLTRPQKPARPAAAPQAPAPAPAEAPQTEAPAAVTRVQVPAQGAPQPAAPRPSPQTQSTPGFNHIRVSGAAAPRFLDEISQFEREHPQPRPAATAPSSLFANVRAERAKAQENAGPDDGPHYVIGPKQRPESAPEAPQFTQPQAPNPETEPAFASPLPPGGVFVKQETPQPEPQPQKSEPQAAPRAPRKAAAGGESSVMKAVLFVRQFAASFFTHTNLGVIFPGVGASLGPCYPSSMPFPYFAAGFIAALPALLLSRDLQISSLLCSSLAVLIYFLTVGISGFRGLSRFCSALSNTRTDHIFSSASLTLYILLFAAVYENLTAMIVSGPQFCLTLGALSMLSALSGCSLAVGSDPDPVDSYGTMTLPGLAFCTIAACAVCFLVFPPLAAVSFLGVALFLRLVTGWFMNTHGIFASRQAVNALQLLVMAVLMVYLIAAADLKLIAF